MNTESKKQTEQHIIDTKGQLLLRSRLPSHWILREYRPDYGLDFALEIFALPKNPAPTATYETLGEHLFIQLKTVESIEAKPLSLYDRWNVEKRRETLDKEDLIGKLETIRFPLETSELVTVERMGVGVPVLLIVADLSKSQCFFVCLNDYIDKVLVPRHDDYRTKATRTIHIPILNEVGEATTGQKAMRWYAKRSKLYAAFQRFVFQAAEIANEWDSPEGADMAKHFASRIASYDFWDNTEMWEEIGHYGSIIKRFVATGSLESIQLDKKAILERAANGDAEYASEITDILRRMEVPEFWRQLSVLPRIYEDICREWYLPTALGYASSYGNYQLR